MIMLGLRFMGEVPFRDVYIHALVRDAEGQKMSKSKGNVVDPLVVMETWGTDAFRFTLAAMAGLGRDIRISEERVEGYRNFANKLWNAARLVLSNLEGYDASRARKTPRGLADRWIESRLAAAIGAVRVNLRRYRFNDAASGLYQFVWHELCDWYLEIAKLALYRAETPAARLRAQHTLVTVLERTLRLLHPFMPFITEELWQRLPHTGESIMVAPYPRVTARQADAAAEREMAILMEVITGIRNVRGEMRISPAVALAVIVRPAPEHAAVLAATAPLVEALARARLRLDANASRPPGAAVALVGGSEVYVDLAGVVDLEAERQRLGKELAKVEETIGFVTAKLARPDFVERAPAAVVERERVRLVEQQALRDKLLASRQWLG
jgi:valyl-tRNA synthetase